MPDLNLAEYLDRRRALVEAALEAALPEGDGPEREVLPPMRYSLLAAGKRLRPILCLAGAEAVGGRAEDALPAAVALEMIHASSLIHDDLPGLDDDDLRRGRPSCHRAFTVGRAVLAGDALLADALAYLVEAGGRAGLPPERVLAAVGRIARAAGRFGVAGGQALDLAAEGAPVDEQAVREIHEAKTAALLSASVAAGGILAGGPAGAVERLERFGRHLGLAFQIVDDILDIEGDAALLGKRIGADEARGKATYPRAVGLDASRERAGEHAEAARAALDGFGPEAEPLRQLAGHLLKRKT